MNTPTLPEAPRPIGLLVKMFPKLSETFVLEEVLGLERLGMCRCACTRWPRRAMRSHTRRSSA